MEAEASDRSVISERIRCPICERWFDPASTDASIPFCSIRCRHIDLGRWLGESYSVSCEKREEDDELDG
ncbi:MAG: DNA gyrase inhibitor YacG [Planctomycetia bacterium]|nr:DNA gyrase inhibitor YacG [Planctomycetia bacterium]